MASARAIEILTRFARVIASDGYSRGLQPVQWQALQYLARANWFSRTPKGLAAWLGQTKGSVSQTILALEAKGMVRRRPDEGDRRVVRVELTDFGRALLTQPPLTLAAQMLDHLSQPDQERFAGEIEAMLREQLAANGQQMFGLCRDCRHFSKPAVGIYRCTLLGVPLDDRDPERICIEQEAA